MAQEKPVSDLQKLNGFVELWVIQNNVTPCFFPSTKKHTSNNPLMPDFESVFLITDTDGKMRKLTMEGVARLISADFYEMGYKYTSDQIKTCLSRWAFNWFKANFQYSAEIAAIPRVKIVRKRGRPRKDGTASTVYLKVSD
jgi:hypothetical protein